MAVRVRVRLESASGRRLEAVAVLNGGFETRIPAVLLPSACARGILSSATSEWAKLDAEVADGVAEFERPPEDLDACVLTPERSGPLAACAVVVSAGAREILLSDTAIDALGVKIEGMGRGLWRFEDEQRIRPSEPPQHWSIDVPG